MKKVNTFGLHFTLRQTKNRDEELPIYLRIVVDKSRSEVSLKYRVKKDDWNSEKGAAKPKNDELRKLNSFLETTRGKVVNHYRELQRNEKEITASSIKNAFLGILAEDQIKHSLLWLAQEHNNLMQKVLKPGSLKNYYTTAKYLKIFIEKKYRMKDIFLKDLNFEFITVFDYFIRNHPIKETDPCTNNGTMKHMERLKKMMNWAVRNEWIEKNPFLNYKLNFKHREREYLTENDLFLMEKANLANPMLQQVKDLFVFCCYTGLTYIDLIKLKRNQIVIQNHGSKWIKTTREKSSVAFMVPLLKPAIEILDKFGADPGVAIRETLFPRISNQEMNRSLKIIGQVCGIDKNLTFHLARHTFATTVTLMNGVPIESISKMLGHSKLSTTMIYARVNQSKIAMDMELLQNKLNER